MIKLRWLPQDAIADEGQTFPRTLQYRTWRVSIDIDGVLVAAFPGHTEPVWTDWQDVKEAVL